MSTQSPGCSSRMPNAHCLLAEDIDHLGTVRCSQPLKLVLSILSSRSFYQGKLDLGNKIAGHAGMENIVSIAMTKSYRVTSGHLRHSSYNIAVFQGN